MVCEGVDGDGDKADGGDNDGDGDGGHLGCGVEGLRGRRLSGPRPGWATAIKYPPQPLPPLVRWAPTRQGPHLTLTKQQVGWGTRLGPNPSG